MCTGLTVHSQGATTLLFPAHQPSQAVEFMTIPHNGMPRGVFILSCDSVWDFICLFLHQFHGKKTTR